MTGIVIALRPVSRPCRQVARWDTGHSQRVGAIVRMASLRKKRRR
jgi:hypothetical protein